MCIRMRVCVYIVCEKLEFRRLIWRHRWTTGCYCVINQDKFPTSIYWQQTTFSLICVFVCVCVYTVCEKLEILRQSYIQYGVTDDRRVAIVLSIKTNILHQHIGSSLRSKNDKQRSYRHYGVEDGRQYRRCYKLRQIPHVYTDIDCNRN